MEIGEQLELVLRLILGLVLAAAVGWERELQRMPAGFRTHALVGLGSAVFTVVGAHKMATFDDMATEGKVTIYDKGFDEAPRGYGEWVTRSGDIYSPRLPTVEPLRLECQEFLDSIEQGRAPRSDGVSGLRVVRALADLQESLKASGRRDD